MVSKALRDEILQAIEKKGISGFSLKRFDYVWGKKMAHGELSQVKLLRLAKKDDGKWQERRAFTERPD